MSRGRKSQPDTATPPISGWVRRLTVLCLLAAGCAGGRGFENDPLTGGPPIPAGTPSTTATAATNRDAGTVVPTVPPLPPASSTTTPAALAAAVPSSPESGRDLRIGGTMISAPGSADGSAWRTPGPPGAVLHGPQPVPEATSRLAPVAATSPGVMQAVGQQGVAGDTYEQLQSMLAARGVTWQRLEQWGDNGEWKFSCSIPNRQDPHVNRLYEVKAPGPHGLAAIRAVLDKIDAEQRPVGG